MPLDDHTASIKALMEEAGEKIQHISRSESYHINYKADQSPVTSADLASEEIICSGLGRLFPGIPVVSEEKLLKNQFDDVINNNYWIVDPIDGTKEFIKGNGEYCICLARIIKGEVNEGYIYAPASSTLWYARKGRGAYKLIEGEAVILPIVKGREKIAILKSRSHSGEIDRKWNSEVSKLYPTEEEYQGSAIKFCRIAEGNGDIYIKPGVINKWDVAAGALIVEESGGKVSSLITGEKLLFSSPGVSVDPFLVTARRIDRETVARLISLAGEVKGTKDERRRTKGFNC